MYIYVDICLLDSYRVPLDVFNCSILKGEAEYQQRDVSFLLCLHSKPPTRELCLLATYEAMLQHNFLQKAP